MFKRCHRNADLNPKKGPIYDLLATKYNASAVENTGLISEENQILSRVLGDGLNDFIMGWCCSLCALSQMSNEAKVVRALSQPQVIYQNQPIQQVMVQPGQPVTAQPANQVSPETNQQKKE